jgi:hypothetical protein
VSKAVEIGVSNEYVYDNSLAIWNSKEVNQYPNAKGLWMLDYVAFQELDGFRINDFNAYLESCTTLADMLKCPRFIDVPVPVTKVPVVVNGEVLLPDVAMPTTAPEVIPVKPVKTPMRDRKPAWKKVDSSSKQVFTSSENPGNPGLMLLAWVSSWFAIPRSTIVYVRAFYDSLVGQGVPVSDAQSMTENIIRALRLPMDRNVYGL